MPLGALATLRRLALFVAAGIEPLAAIPLSGSPWRQPRNPARHIGAIAFILGSEAFAEPRLLNGNYPSVKKEPEQRAVAEEMPVGEQHRLTKNDGNDCNIDRIAHIAI